ncbi:hypothetical protein ABZ372_39880, partial [Streptomyces sp. NPDC005921]
AALPRRAANYVQQVGRAGRRTGNAFLLTIPDLDGGGRLTALQQNLDTSAEDVAAYRGTRVRLRWQRRHTVHVPD